MLESLAQVVATAVLVVQLVTLFVLVGLLGSLLLVSRRDTLLLVQRSAVSCGAAGVLSGVAAAVASVAVASVEVSFVVLVWLPALILVLAFLVAWWAGRAAAGAGVDDATVRVVEDFNRRHRG